jgi:hypothetical protein
LVALLEDVNNARTEGFNRIIKPEFHKEGRF